MRFCCLVGLLACMGSGRAAEPAIEVFDATKVWPLHLELSAKEYEAMQPAAPGGFGFPGGGFPGRPAPAPKPAGDRKTHRSVFGTEFPIARGTIFHGETKSGDVAVRYKGNSTYLASARNLKRSFKIDVDEFVDGQKFLGLKTLNLHCGVHDPSKLREALAYEVFRAASVPAPRTAFVELTLTVPGKYDKELVGFYTLAEAVNKPFLKRHFQTDKGLLMKPERVRGLDYLGDDWEKYETTYQPKREPTKAEKDRTIAFAKLVNRGTDAEFAEKIGEYLDVDAFLKFQAATAMVANLDSFFTNGHNYYLYLHPETNRFHFIPWDTDLSLGNFAFFGNAAQQSDLSLTKPYAQNKLADRVLALKGTSEKYRAIAKEMAGNAFAKERVLKVAAGLEAAAQEPLAREAKATAARKEPANPGGGAFGAKPPTLENFVAKRVESIAAQLDGKSTGFVPQAFGPPGGGFGPPPGQGQIAKPFFDAMDADKNGKVTEAEMKKLFADWDTNGDGNLDPAEVAAGMQKLVPTRPQPGPVGRPR